MTTAGTDNIPEYSLHQNVSIVETFIQPNTLAHLKVHSSYEPP